MSKHTKSNNRRKAAAVALAVLGVTGLTLASAAQLNLSTPASVQAGVTTVAPDCQPADKPITVAFTEPTLSGGQYRSASVTLSGIDAQCVEGNKDFKAALLGASDAVVGTEASGKASATITLPLGAVSQYDVRKVALTIY